MEKRLPRDADIESQDNGDNLGLTEVSQPLFSNEWFFNREVHEFAIHHGWRPFHATGFRVVRGRGFPDLAMFRKDPDTGSFEMLVAELKKDAYSEFGEGQEEWLQAFKQMGITTKVWRGDSMEHLAEMYDIIEKGTEGQDSVTELLPPPSGPIPVNFTFIMNNILEEIEGNEMSRGDKASLRRMEYNNPDCAVFWRLISQRGMPRNLDIAKWGLIAHGIALMAHSAPFAHHPRRPVGRILFEGGGEQSNRGFYSEDRLTTLLSAKGETLRRLLARVFRILSSQGCAFNWQEMAWFILNEGHNEEEANKSRIGIARAYYRAERRSAVASENQND